MTEPEVVAAGGVVWRNGGAGVEVVVVHRPRYDDWSLPKGKVDGDESLEACALREVEEETGYRCTLGRRLGTSRYRDRKGRDKEVTYWAMTVDGGRFRPGPEVDELRWLPLAAARQALSYERDAGILAELEG